MYGSGTKLLGDIEIEGGQHENRTAGQGLEEEDGAEEKRNRGIVV